MSPAVDDPSSGEVTGGSIILIDPATSGIIGTLTPASPDGADNSDRLTGDSVQSEATAFGIPASLISGDSGDGSHPDRRVPTYSCRLSISDLSLRTFADPGALHPGDSEYTYPPDTVAGDPGSLPATHTEVFDGNGRNPLLRSSFMTDDASFWTARGTLRLDDGTAGAGGAEREREVVVAYIQTDTPVSHAIIAVLHNAIADPRPSSTSCSLLISPHRSARLSRTPIYPCCDRPPPPCRRAAPGPTLHSLRGSCISSPVCRRYLAAAAAARAFPPA
jgi:hypothetical protein